MEALAPEIINPHGTFPGLLVCDHASHFVPASYAHLGLNPALLETHIGVDIGIAAVVRYLAALLDAPAILAPCSRLLVDCNRWIEDAHSMPEISDTIPIPANIQLDDKARHERCERYFRPYHEAIARLFADLRTRIKRPLFLSLHSCTRSLSDGLRRELDGGTIWHESAQLAKKLQHGLEEKGLIIGDNSPYSGLGGTFCIDYHTWGSDCPACGLEIVNDLIRHEDEQQKWASLLANILKDIVHATPSQSL